MKHVVDLLSKSPLESFMICSPISFNFIVEDEFWTQLTLTHGKRLLQFVVSKTLIGWEALHSICVQCTKLEIVSVSVDPDDLVRTLASFFLEELVF